MKWYLFAIIIMFSSGCATNSSTTFDSSAFKHSEIPSLNEYPNNNLKFEEKPKFYQESPEEKFQREIKLQEEMNKIRNDQLEQQRMKEQMDNSYNNDWNSPNNDRNSPNNDWNSPNNDWNSPNNDRNSPNNDWNSPNNDWNSPNNDWNSPGR